MAPKPRGAFALSLLERMWGRKSTRLPPPREQMGAEGELHALPAKRASTPILIPKGTGHGKGEGQGIPRPAEIHPDQKKLFPKAH